MDWDFARTRTAGANQTIVHQYVSTVSDTYWVVRQNPTLQPVGTNVTLSVTAAPAGGRFNFSAVEILPAP
jgi:hypothetical protein